VVTPTNLAAAFPYGGEELGLAKFTTLEIGERRSGTIRDEYRGGDPVESFFLGEDWFASATLTQWADDTLASVFTGIASGTGVLPRKSYDGLTPLPALLSARGKSLLFVPEHVVAGGDKQAPEALSWIMYRAVPILEKPIPFSAFLSTSLSVAWEGYRDATGRFGHLASFGDLAL